MLALIIIFVVVALVYAGSRSRRAKAPASLLRRSVRIYVAVLFLAGVLAAVPLVSRLLNALLSRTASGPKDWIVWATVVALAAAVLGFAFFAFRIFKVEVTDFRRRHESPKE